jgi:hypothetical protein
MKKGKEKKGKKTTQVCHFINAVTLNCVWGFMSNDRLCAYFLMGGNTGMTDLRFFK